MVEEKKTLFEHLGIKNAGDKKTLFEHIGINKYFTKYNGTIKRLVFFICGGFVGGLIVDISLGTDIFKAVIPLCSVLFLLFKWYKN